MKLARSLACLAAAALVSGCSSSTTAPAPSGTVVVFSNPATLPNDGSQAQVTATVTDANGNPGSGSISFTASAGALNGAGVSTTASLVGGMATVTYACNVATDATHCGAQTVLLTAAWTGLAGGTHITLQGPGGGGGGTGGTTGGSDAGVTTGSDGGVIAVGPPSAIVEVSAVPSVLGLKGSGIQENGLMTFLVTDSMGNPVSGATVNFTQAQPALLTLGHASAVTNSAGTVVADYSAGPNVGVTSVVATVASTGATTSHPVAVRGARPSASGFYFRCDRSNLPVYTTTLAYETTTCIVRLSDRYGNRVGIATPVGFAAEAGAISATATTKPFDYNDPTNPDEGTVSVTFSTDMGNGFSPVQTVPMLADATQYPKQRAAEPFAGAGPSYMNPRDQLVTIIAMVRGEEAFVDANLNGQYDPGELFVDQGDPYIDSNDNNVYDGATEPRFCGGSSCGTYHGPNGAWDSDRTIWVPTWVAFTDGPIAAFTPWSPSSCLDYTDNSLNNPIAATTTVTMVDEWLNTAALGTTYAATVTSAQTGAKLTVFGGFSELDHPGSSDVSWELVSAADNTKACSVANAPNGACVMLTELGQWDSGARLALNVANGNATPTAAKPGHACGVPTAGTHLDTFTVDVTATVGQVTTHSAFSGQFGY